MSRPLTIERNNNRSAEQTNTMTFFFEKVNETNHQRLYLIHFAAQNLLTYKKNTQIFNNNDCDEMSLITTTFLTE